jgi:hypothetical protein
MFLKAFMAASLGLLLRATFSGRSFAEMRIFELKHPPAGGMAEKVRDLSAPRFDQGAWGQSQHCPNTPRS